MHIGVGLAVVLTVAACSAGGPEQANDPLEPMNRRVHAFNAGLDSAVIRPMTRAAGGSDAPRTATTGRTAADDAGPEAPGPVEVIGNVGSNLALPGKAVNHLLQGHPEPAIRNGFRFLVNSTFGVAGLFDPAGADFGLPEIDTDFGETLHVWGIPEGAYLVLPVLGPSTARDTAGKIVDAAIDPTRAWLTPEQRIGATAARLVSKAGDRAQFGSTVDSVLHESADSYAQTRLLYLQHRRFELKQEQDVIDPYAE